MGERRRLLFTFDARDFACARALAEQFRLEGGRLSVDLGITSEPFATQRADYIRASFAARIRRSLAVVCLFGSDTFADDWVLWTLETAHRLGRPIVGSPLVHAPAPAAVDLFDSLGAAIVAPQAETLARHVSRIDRRREGSRPVAEEALLVLRAMRHDTR
mgnify:CR=1 FL=1